MNHHWNWGVFFTEAAQNQTYLDQLLAGLKTTVVLGLSSWIIALVIGPVLDVLCTVPNKWLSSLAAACVGAFRNVPLIMQLFIWCFIMPEFVSDGDYIKQMNPTTAIFLSAILCLGTSTVARVYEQVRSSINSLPRGQRNASLAIDFTLAQTYRYVILPMSFHIIVPPLTSEFLNIFKNSAMASTVGLLELAAQGRQLVGYTAQPYESSIAMTLMYMLINLAVMGLMRWVGARSRLPGFIGGRQSGEDSS